MFVKEKIPVAPTLIKFAKNSGNSTPETPKIIPNVDAMKEGFVLIRRIKGDDCNHPRWHIFFYITVMRFYRFVLVVVFFEKFNKNINKPFFL